jgi:dTDP-4-amino-4,6-dideoxy-D-galactose acyltransferase
MNVELQPLAWDSSFLGYAVGRLQPSATDAATVQALLHQARQLGFRLLYWNVGPADPLAAATAQQVGALLVDEKVTFTMSVPEEPVGLSANISPAAELTAQLTHLAWQAGHHSRYFTDPNFAPGVYERLYGRWIENSVNGVLAREVLVYRSEPGSEATGLITLASNQQQATIGLLAVDVPVRSQAIGTHLVAAAQQRARAWNCDTLQVVTQLTNRGACRFYEQCGFHIEQVEHVYHVWLK